MELLIELVKLATALVVFATVLSKSHPEVSDDRPAKEDEGR